MFIAIYFEIDSAAVTASSSVFQTKIGKWVETQIQLLTPGWYHARSPRFWIAYDGRMLIAGPSISRARIK